MKRPVESLILSKTDNRSLIPRETRKHARYDLASFGLLHNIVRIGQKWWKRAFKKEHRPTGYKVVKGKNQFELKFTLYLIVIAIPL